MKNAKSTIAMRLAHKIAKQYPKASFKACLKMAWKIVRIDITVAQRILFGVYKFTFVKTYNATFGDISVMMVKAKGIKAKIKRLLTGKRGDYIFSRFAF